MRFWQVSAQFSGDQVGEGESPGQGHAAVVTAAECRGGGARSHGVQPRDHGSALVQDVTVRVRVDSAAPDAGTDQQQPQPVKGRLADRAQHRIRAVGRIPGELVDKADAAAAEVGVLAAFGMLAEPCRGGFELLAVDPQGAAKLAQGRGRGHQPRRVFRPGRDAAKPVLPMVLFVDHQEERQMPVSGVERAGHQVHPVGVVAEAPSGAINDHGVRHRVFRAVGHRAVGKPPARNHRHARRRDPGYGAAHPASQHDAVASHAVRSQAAEVLRAQAQQVPHERRIPVEAAGGEHDRPEPLDRPGCGLRPRADHLPGGIAQQFGHPGLQPDLDAFFPESPGEELGDQPGAEGQDIAAGRACCGRAAAPAREHVLVRGPGAEVGADPEPGPPRPQRTALERAAGQVASGCERTVGLGVIIGEPADHGP